MSWLHRSDWIARSFSSFSKRCRTSESETVRRSESTGSGEAEEIAVLSLSADCGGTLEGVCVLWQGMPRETQLEHGCPLLHRNLRTLQNWHETGGCCREPRSRRLLVGLSPSAAAGVMLLLGLPFLRARPLLLDAALMIRSDAISKAKHPWSPHGRFHSGL